jgi:hypothetical protein
VDTAIGVEAVDGHDGLFEGFVAEVAGVAEVDAALGVEGDVVGGVEGFAFEQAGEDDAFAGGEVGAGDAAAAVVGAFGGEEAALGVEFEAVGHAAGGAVDGGAAGGGVEAEDAGRRACRFGGEGDVAEEDGAVGSDGDAFGEVAAFVDFFEFGAGGEDLRGEGGGA